MQQITFIKYFKSTTVQPHLQSYRNMIRSHAGDSSAGFFLSHCLFDDTGVRFSPDENEDRWSITCINDARDRVSA